MKIGTCVRGEELLVRLPELMADGFETVELYFNETLGGMDFSETAKRAREIIGDADLEISSIGLYCNPLHSAAQREELAYCIDHAHLFGASVVGTFAGAIPGKNAGDAIPQFKAVFRELTKRAESAGVQIGIENAHMYGHWYQPTCNIGFCPKAWEMMFEAVDSPTLGLEWEPSHQIEQLIDPIRQLERWVHKIVHVHGKDAKLNPDAIAENGIWFGSKYCVHRFPGLGECDWSEIMRILHAGGYTRDICIEGFHDPVFCGSREMEGQRNTLRYLKACRMSMRNTENYA